MGLAFATVMRLEARAARNYTEAVRAEFVARAGIEDAIGRLRVMAREGAEAAFLAKDPATGTPLAVGRPAEWYTWRGTAGGAYKVSYPASKESNWFDDDEDGDIDGDDADGDGTGLCSYTDGLGDGGFYTLKIEDAASKINVNVGDNLGTILDNLCRVIGSPLRAADQRALVPSWFSRLPQYAAYGKHSKNIDDRLGVYDLFYRLGPDERPLCRNVDGNNIGQDEATFGDGYAIAGYRSRHGEFLSLEDVRKALTWIERGDGDNDGDDADGDGQEEPEPDMPEEQLEVESKFAALRPYITIDSWFDTDQIGYGKFEQVKIADGNAVELTDRNACWNIKRNPETSGWIPLTNTIAGQPYAGELKGCYVAIVNGVGQNQIKTIAANTADTIVLSDSFKAGSEMRVPPNQHSSYVIIGKDAGTDANWKEQLKLYARQPLSFHRSPVNINTASDKVLTALLMGLQTTWGRAGYTTRGTEIPDMGGWAGTTNEWADAMWQCPSIMSLGRDACNAYLSFNVPCPNDTTFAYADENQQKYGHADGREPFCFLCSFGHLCPRESRASIQDITNEAHYLVWQILKEREQTAAQDLSRGHEWANGYGPFRGWDDIFFRVFYPHEKGLKEELHTKPRAWLSSPKTGHAASSTSSNWTLGTRHPGIARLCMANFNSNTGLLKFQPNLEYIDRWGPNFTDLFVPRPELLKDDVKDNVDIKLRVRPGELLDKSDLNIGTTEFCFDSGGVYDIESIGRVYDRAKTVTAERRYRALVKVYDVWRESTQREFAMGHIAPARDAAGTRQAGQFTVDGTGGTDPRDFRKALCTYPEAIVPPGHVVGRDTVQAKIAALAYDKTNPVLQPAGYDGQILLAVNMYYESVTQDVDLGFYHSFTGDVLADSSRGDPRPGESTDIFTANVAACPLDMVSLLGALNSKDCDLKPTVDANGDVVEGEGKGGDLRPDGMHLGVVGKDLMDGSFDFEVRDNVNKVQGAITMWIKPLWHHGTVACASLPVVYNPKRGDQRGSTVCIPDARDFGPYDAPGPLPGDWHAKWKEYWRSPFQKYGSTEAIGKNARGYVRDRFEYELFNAVEAALGQGANNFRLLKAGDRFCSIDDLDWWGTGGEESGRAPFAGLEWQAEIKVDNNTWVPGHLAADGRPFYQISPFRWTFFGFTWDSGVAADGWPVPNAWRWDTTAGRGETGENTGHFPEVDQSLGRYSHRMYGQPQGMTTLLGDLKAGGSGHGRESGIVEDWGNEMSGDQDGNLDFVRAVPYGHKKDRTAHDHLGLCIVARPFSDGMRTWNKQVVGGVNDEGEGNPPNYDSRYHIRDKDHYDLEDMAFEQYSTMLQRHDSQVTVLSQFKGYSFGVNKKSLMNNYQAFYSGTYATVDEYKIHLSARNKNLERDYRWGHKERNKTGRYYFPVDPTRPFPGQVGSEQEPSFESQDMLQSEQSQSYTFGIGEEEDELEICTVRWTVFTPFYCVDKGAPASAGTDEWRFPFDGYFDSDTGDSRFGSTYRDVASPAQIRLYHESGTGEFTQARFGADATSPVKKDIRDNGVASRYSSQRGCKVKVQARSAAGTLSWFPSTTGVFYEYPEGGYNDPTAGCTENGWQQVLLDPGSPTGEHPKCRPDDLKYKVFFRLSDMEYEQMRGDSALLDSPVFDDITIVCMRRPKVLEWRDVTE
ncbi:MAG: hypothetical protein ACYTKD_15220 [Planctomycetota bacterium]|jgi:hypothetical protein